MNISNITSLIFNRLIPYLSGKISELLELNKFLLTPTSNALLNQDTQNLNELKIAIFRPTWSLL